MPKSQAQGQQDNKGQPAWTGALPPAVDGSVRGETVRVNIRSEVNAKEIRREKRFGRDVIVVPSYTLPDDIVMNGILYPAAEIEAAYKGLEGTPAPLGHPHFNGNYVSARSPLGLNMGFFGAFNANALRQDGRVFIEKVIDVERATESAMGRRVLEALEANEPIHTSTGLLMNLRECANQAVAEWEGYDFEFDHDAILLDQEGAATPEQGVGMLVNSGELRVINSDISQARDHKPTNEEIAAFSREGGASIWSAFREAINEAIRLGRSSEPFGKEDLRMATNNEDGSDKIDARLTKIEERLNAMEEKVSNMGKDTKANSDFIQALNADREAERAVAVAEIVKTELLTEEDAKATPLPALNALLKASKAKGEPVPAPGIPPGFSGPPTDGAGVDFDPLSAPKEA